MPSAAPAPICLASSDDVGRAGACRRGRWCCWLCIEPDSAAWSPGRCSALWLVSPLVAWWLSRPLSAPPVRLSEQQRAFLRQAVPADLAILRGLCHRGRELAAARQFPGATRRRSSPRAPARPTSAWRCWRTWPPATSATAPPAGCSTAPRRRSARWPAWSAIAAISTTGTTRVRSSRCSPLYVSTVDSGNLAGASAGARAAACWN